MAPLSCKGHRHTGAHSEEEIVNGFKTTSNEEPMKDFVFSLDNRRSVELPELFSNGQQVDRLS